MDLLCLIHVLIQLATQEVQQRAFQLSGSFQRAKALVAEVYSTSSLAASQWRGAVGV
jgi:hypothetical protein